MERETEAGATSTRSSRPFVTMVSTDAGAITTPSFSGVNNTVGSIQRLHLTQCHGSHNRPFFQLPTRASSRAAGLGAQNHPGLLDFHLHHAAAVTVCATFSAHRKSPSWPS